MSMKLKISTISSYMVTLDEIGQFQHRDKSGTPGCQIVWENIIFKSVQIFIWTSPCAQASPEKNGGYWGFVVKIENENISSTFQRYFSTVCRSRKNRLKTHIILFSKRGKCYLFFTFDYLLKFNYIVSLFR